MDPDQKPTHTWRLSRMSQALDEPESSLRERAAHCLGLSVDQLRGFRIVKRSVDARKRGPLAFVCTVDLIVDAGLTSARMRKLEKSGQVRPAPLPGSLLLNGSRPKNPDDRVVVVGAGPGGLLAALTLALNGVEVDLIERGEILGDRSKSLASFHRTGDLNLESNLLFGEGGAGTYSDGKLYTRVKSDLEVPILEELVAAGAQPEILFDSRAHIGTDRLHTVLPRLRERMQAAGVRFHFDTRLESLLTGPDQALRAVKTQQGELPAVAVFLALGHSARDTWQSLHEQGVPFEPKPFQFGVRVEHPQELITRGRYADRDPGGCLGPASYSLVCRAGGNLPAVHSFCMCPGGKIVASVNEPGLLCTNGMSNSTHSSAFANAALVTTVDPSEYAAFGAGAFAGVAYQRHFEQRCFEAGGGGYTAPAQRVTDFLEGRLSSGDLRTSYSFGAVPRRVDELIPAHSRDALRRALHRFEAMLPGFAGEQGILVGVEARSSGPVRCPRDAHTRQTHGWGGLYPIGEGAGYAGGIMSAALDGALAAHAWLKRTNVPPRP